MASFIINKKKKYKFNVEVCLEELLEVPFVNAVLFAKLRHDASNFVGHSSRVEVRDHTVHWHAPFSFPCKMSANASTGVLDRCVLRISVRKECKGGRSFTKLGFVDLNLAEYAGSVVPAKKALLEGYDTRHRLDNSMLKFGIKVHLLSGDTIFKVPSPSLKSEEVSAEDNITDNRVLDEFSSGSLGGSIASGSSGFGSLTKKRPQLLQSELVIGGTIVHPSYSSTNATLSEGGNTLIMEDHTVPCTVSQQQQQQQAGPCADGGQLYLEHLDAASCEPPGHSRNSSNTSQMSKGSGYSSGINSHSRQSSSGDSGHMSRTTGKPSGCKRSAVINIPSTLSEIPSPIPNNNKTCPNGYIGASSPEDVYLTPRSSIGSNREHNTRFLSQLSDELTNKTDSFYYSVNNNNSECFEVRVTTDISSSTNRSSLQEHKQNKINDNGKLWANDGVFRSKSDFLIPQRISPDFLLTAQQKSTSFARFKDFLTPQTRRKEFNVGPVAYSTPNNKSPSNSLNVKLMAGIPSKNNPVYLSTNSLKCQQQQQQDQAGAVPRIVRNPSSGSLVVSETGSLDRTVKVSSSAQAQSIAPPRRKLHSSATAEETDCAPPGRVEGTRVDVDDFISELLTQTNLNPTDDSNENSGLQLFIAKDGTAALGNHDLKSAGIFKQVVVENNR